PSVDRFPRNVELLHDFFDGGSGFQVFEHGRHWHPSIAKHPSAAQPSRYAFNRRTLRPIEGAMFFVLRFLSTTVRRRRHVLDDGSHPWVRKNLCRSNALRYSFRVIETRSP